MNPKLFPSVLGGHDQQLPAKSLDDVVELGLLLPTNRATELLQLARDRHESVGQLLRKMIDRELARTA